MKMCNTTTKEALRAARPGGRMHGRLVLPQLLWILLSTPALWAQQSSITPRVDGQTIQMLLQRIDQLEARVRELEATKPKAPPAIPSSAPPQAEKPPATENESKGEHPEHEGMELNKTLLRIRGFSDVTLHGSNDNRPITPEGKARVGTTSFSLGQLNLFVTSDVSEKFRFLSEIVFEAGSDNAVGVDVERMLLQYSPNDYFNLAVGRYHTAIGYYNTAYHHSTWFQTTTGRPFLFDFEDKGGPLPVHNVGVSASGLIPSGRLGLHYVAEVGNGRASRSPASEPWQNLVDENNHKAFNLAFFARPESVRGLQAGFSVYRDVLAPANSPRIGATILASHAVLVRPKFERLNDALVIRHAPFGLSHAFETPGFYTQLSK